MVTPLSTLLKHATSNTILTIIDTKQYSITFFIIRGDTATTWTSIYASLNHTMHPTLWTYLTNLSYTITGPWMLIGDFNETIFLGDQRGGIFNQNRLNLFANLMDNCNLLDLATIWGRFIWHHNQNGIRILSNKIDRVLANVDWRLSILEASVAVLL